MQTITVNPYPATQLVNAGEGTVLLQNADLNNTIYLGDTSAANVSDTPNIVPLSPQSYLVVTGSKEVWGVTETGKTAQVYKIASGTSFFQSGITGESIIINKLGLFIYNGTPGLGNPPIAEISNSKVDPFGNVISGIANFGPLAGAHFGIDVSGNIYLADTNGNTRIYLNPGEQFMGFYLNSHGSGEYPNIWFSINDITDNGNQIPQGIGTGLPILCYYGDPSNGGKLIGAISPINAGDAFGNYFNAGMLISDLVAPDPTNTVNSVPETWKDMGSVTTNGGWPPAFAKYRMSPFPNKVDTYIQFVAQATNSTGTYTFDNPLLSEYWPVNQQVLNIRWNALSYTSGHGTLLVNTNGTVQYHLPGGSTNLPAGTIAQCTESYYLN